VKNNEKVVLAAVQQNGYSLEYASEEMKNNETVVLDAVQKAGRSLVHASGEMKNNETVVLAAVQQNGVSLVYASEEMKINVNAIIREFGCAVEEAARALAQPRVVQLSAKHGSDDIRGEPGIAVTGTNLAGEVVATVLLTPDCNSHELWQRISDKLDLSPNWPGPAFLRLILPSGEQLRRCTGDKALNTLGWLKQHADA